MLHAFRADDLLGLYNLLGAHLCRKLILSHSAAWNSRFFTSVPTFDIFHFVVVVVGIAVLVVMK